ncbi:tyrosine-type recombinase/integrase [Parafrankia sp. FMc2]|uniref:tyrosine-type recombinase/integrase n=1 Tax=Parafrankia sp. FMc2 TaxID=3233196 RepID=UPI0034D7006F
MWNLLLINWDLALESADRKPNTRRIYLHAGRLFVAWLLALAADPTPGALDAHGRPALPRPAGPEDITRQHVEAFLVDFRRTPTPRCPDGPGQAYVNQIYRALQQWMGYLIDSEDIDRSPMERIKAPAIDETIKPELTDDHVKALLASCKAIKTGNPKEDSRRRFVALRDEALIRTFLDTGARRAEVAGMTLADVDLHLRTIKVTGKGGRDRIPGIGRTTALALGRYQRLRAGTKYGNETDAWWLNEFGTAPLTHSGLGQLIERRGLAIGRPGTHWHEFRRKLADDWLDNGGDRGALMVHAGWTSHEMVERYGAAGKRRRARNAHARLGLADRF